MFSNLRQGATVYVLEQSNNLQLKTGNILENKPNYTGGMDMKVKVDDQEYDLKQLPYNQIIAKTDQLMVFENKTDAIKEVKKLKEESEKILNDIDYYKQTVEDCDMILRQNDSSYDKEQKQNEEIQTLKDQIAILTQSLSNIEKQLLNKEK